MMRNQDILSILNHRARSSKLSHTSLISPPVSVRLESIQARAALRQNAEHVGQPRWRNAQTRWARASTKGVAATMKARRSRKVEWSMVGSGLIPVAGRHDLHGGNWPVFISSPLVPSATRT